MELNRLILIIMPLFLLISCSKKGCTIEGACNFDSANELNDDSCYFCFNDDCENYPNNYYSCDGECLVDFDNDFICDNNEIEGCLDETACNYNEFATDEAECTYTLDYYDCDGNCVAEIDECGTCGGDGSTYGYDCEGICLNDLDSDGICDEFESITDYDNNIYSTVLIGDQLLITKNLQVTHYRNGDEITTDYSNLEWESVDETETGAYSVYNDDILNVETYGYLYNWYAVDDDREICPEWFHVPSDEEWTTLILFLDENADPDGWWLYQSETAGEMMKEEGFEHWLGPTDPNDDATNESGFTGLPGGYRGNSGYYNSLGFIGIFWSSTEYGSNGGYYRALHYGSPIVQRYYNPKSGGFSVRCLGD